MKVWIPSWWSVRLSEAAAWKMQLRNMNLHTLGVFTKSNMFLIVCRVAENLLLNVTG